MKPNRTTCSYCCKSIHWGYVNGRECIFDLDTNKKHTCKFDITKKRGITHQK